MRGRKNTDTVLIACGSARQSLPSPGPHCFASNPRKRQLVMTSAPHETIVLAAVLLVVGGGVGCGRATSVVGSVPADSVVGSVPADSAVGSIVGSVPADSVVGSVPADSAVGSVVGSVPADSVVGSAPADSAVGSVDGSVPTDSVVGSVPADSAVGAGLLVANGNDATDRSAALDSQPLRYTVRKAFDPNRQPAIPPVLLSAGHAKLSRVQVGDSFPQLQLPRLGGANTDLSTLRGQRATVILFWNADRWMARTALTDMQRDIANHFDAGQVGVVGIAVRQPAGAVQAALNRAQVTFPQFLDSDGRSFATLGSVALPRIYVLDRAGRIVWFDIEYSEGTRRELWQTLHVLTK